MAEWDRDANLTLDVDRLNSVVHEAVALTQGPVRSCSESL